jgi:2-keto-4-pentenoate hydratase/2-oxohepta-3-ene-1,7-dioic acid hydratase in catechol pathway
MRAFCYTTSKGEPRIGIVYENRRYDFTRIWSIFKEIRSSPRTPDYYFIQLMIEMENFSRQAIAEVIEEVKQFRGLDDLVIKSEITYDVPVQRPPKILCLGRNYREHAKEMQNAVPEQPMFFAKLTSALLPHEGNIRLPQNVGRVDHEIELAVIIGKTAGRVRAEEAMEYVAGYAIANDISARAMQKEAMSKGQPWTLSKGMDTFLPIGPYLVPADAVENPHNLEMELTVNDQMRQKSSTANMVFRIPEIIAYISRYVTLQPGDIICTGTPEGVGPIEPGDLVQAKIEGLGVLRNQVIGG